MNFVMLVFYTLLLHLCIATNVNLLEYDLGAKHGLNSSSVIPRESLQKILDGAENGNRDNLYFLGLLKFYGISVTKDINLAIQSFQKAAKLGHPDAQSALAMCYVNGIGVKQDYVAAHELLRKAVDQDDTNGYWLLLEGKGVPVPNHVEAFVLFNKAADRHIPHAEHYVGLMYEYGLGVAQSFVKAAEYYRRGAEQKYIESMYNLALLYLYGRGFPQNFARALSLFDQAAVSDHAPSAYYMGIMKMYGYSCEPDYEEALHWFEKAFVLDDPRISESAEKSFRELAFMISEANEINDARRDMYMKRSERESDE